MTEEHSGARVTIRKRSNSGEGAAVGGADPVRADANPSPPSEEGQLTAVAFHLTPLPHHEAPSRRTSVMFWANDRIGAFFGRAPSVDVDSGAIYFLDGPWPAPGAIATFADSLEVDAERLGYRC